MTTRRVIIDATASSPLRVSAAGVDASGATFDNLIFDANQPPLRVYLNGWMRVPVMSVGAVFANWANGPPYREGPAGTHPIFMVMWTQPATDRLLFWRNSIGVTPMFRTGTVVNNGAGGSVGGGIFTGITFEQEAVLPSGFVYTFPDATHVGYCIMEDYE